MIKSQHIITLLLYTLILLGCKKDEPASCQETGNENCEDIQNVKKVFYFKVGSYWVYEEEISGDLDTVYVTESAHDPSSYYFEVRMYSTHQDYYYHFWPQNAASSQNCVDFGLICERCAKVKLSKYKSGDYVGEGTCFIFLPKPGEFDYNPNSQDPNNIVYVDDSLSEFVLDSFVFERTIKMHELHEITENYQPTNHYFSENVGLVRKELIDSNKVWNLIDYYIQP
jgi:hypothetical protein